MFAKAKLCRFNEVTSETPSPANYTIQDTSKVTGAALSKTERFAATLISPASSDISIQSCHLPVFRTPNLPPRRKPKNVTTLKPVELFQADEALKEKTVECNNKDQYITELIEQLDDYKQQLHECRLKVQQASDENSQLAEALQDSTSDKQVLLDQHSAKIEQLTGNFEEASVLAEIRHEEKCESIESDWRLKLQEVQDESAAILKECQTIAEYNVMQTEIEKNRIAYDFDEYKTQALNEQRVRDESIVQLEQSIAEMTKLKKRYEITIENSHVLIETLKNRLLNSDKDVEQLKTELEDTEALKLECEGRCGKLETELQVLLELFDKDVQQNKREAKENVERIENELILKVDNFKAECDLKVAAINDELTLTKNKLSKALANLNKQHELNDRAQQMINNSIKQIDEFENVNGRMRDLEEMNKALLNKIAEMEALAQPFDELLAKYQVVLAQKLAAEQEAKDIGLKYAQLIGHQNQKQKIKHLIDLKTKNNELTETIIELEAKIQQIEKFKKETMTPAKISKKKRVEDKENILVESPLNY